MTLIERYIFRIAFSAFVGILVALTAVIWITQALRSSTSSPARARRS